ncbi:MAG TPA: ferrochelatase [candidate division Zixibacteria bacterium]|nr:ferrochelatase [candidate division Zixibacteria bacterium]
MGKAAVLLLAHGTPDTIEEIPQYLRNVTSGRPLPEAVVEEIKHRYAQIGHSPLTEITMRQAELVSEELHMPVYVGMRNWRPYIGDTVRQMAADGVTEAVAICLAPHNSRTSVGLYRRAVVGETGNAPFTVNFVESWHDHPLLIEAFGERLRAGYSRACEEYGGELAVILTAHSVPVRTVEAGDPYEKQARHTAELVAACVPEIENWSFAFQSQGMSGGAWLGPTVEDRIAGLAKFGHKGVFVQPIGFVCDHVEILYDIDIMFRDVAAQQGMKLWRAESLNDSALFVRAVAALAREHMTGQQGVRLR